MKNTFRLSSLVSIFAILLGANLFIQEAQAAGLWWSSTEINTNNVNACLEFGGKVLTNSGFSNVKVSGSDASGSKGSSNISIVCIGSSPKVSAVIMAQGRSGAPLEYVHNLIQPKIAAFPTVPAVPAQATTTDSTTTTMRSTINLGSLSKTAVAQTPFYFYWRTARVRTNTVAKCYQLARPDFNILTNFRETKGSELSGSSGANFAAAKCFQTGSSTTALIAVVGEDNDQTRNWAASLAYKISNRVFID